MFKNAAQSDKNITLLPERWRLALRSALVTPICISLVVIIVSAPMIVKSEAATDSLFETAVVNGDAEMAAALLRHGANVNAKSRYGGNVLLTAFAFGRMPLAGTPNDIVRFLLDNGADVNAVEAETGATLLMRASAGYGRLEEFKLLLDHKPDLHAVDREGNGALYYALRSGQIDKAAILMDRDHAPVSC